MAAHSISNIFYILRKDLSVDDRRAVLINLCYILTVESVDSVKVVSALKNSKFDDLEDCLQNECATAVKAGYIVTRNIKDFKDATVAAILPEQLLSVIDE